MPPWVLMRPSSTVSPPGPTCFQPVRSLPLKSCFQSDFWAWAAVIRIVAATVNPTINQSLRMIVNTSKRANEERFLTRHGGSGITARCLKTNHLESQSAQIGVALGDAGKSVAGIVLLDEVVLDTGFAGVRENLLPGNDAAADVSEKLHLSVRAGGRRVLGLGKLLDVLNVNEREAAGILVEIFDRVFAGDGDPAEVELHFDVLGIGGEENVIGKFAAERF